jgi:transcriptional regulator with XRE-family HTH domain
MIRATTSNITTTATSSVPLPDALLRNQFGVAVRQAREKRGWTQELLADRANLNRTYLGEIERGIVMPSLSTIAKLAGAFNIEISALIVACETINAAR